MKNITPKAADTIDEFLVGVMQSTRAAIHGDNKPVVLEPKDPSMIRISAKVEQLKDAWTQNFGTTSFAQELLSEFRGLAIDAVAGEDASAMGITLAEYRERGYAQ